MKLRDIAKIQIGYQFRAKVENTPDGDLHVIQIKDIDDDNLLNTEDLYKVKIDKFSEKYLVDKGDILFLSRGTRNFATPINVHLHNTIAISYFYIIRLKKPRIIPEYLAWYINQQPAQNYIKSHARGSGILLIPKADFEQLKVSVPPVEVQKTIIKLDNLRREEEYLIDSLKEKRDHLVRSICLKAARKSGSKKKESSDVR